LNGFEIVGEGSGGGGGVEMGKKEEETRQKAGGVEGHFLLEEGHFVGFLNSFILIGLIHEGQILLDNITRIHLAFEISKINLQI
jgi:hypothetical protein